MNRTHARATEGSARVAEWSRVAAVRGVTFFGKR